MNNNNLFKIASIVIVALLYFLLTNSISEGEKKLFPSVHSPHSHGTNTLALFLEQHWEKRVLKNYKNLYFSNELQSDRLLFFFDPQFPFTQLELKELKDFIYSGGEIYFSFTQKKLLNIFMKGFAEQQQFGEFDVEKIKDFENGKTQIAYDQEGKDYEVYSHLKFILEDKDSLKAYYKVIESGRGKVHIQLGLPLMANFLIDKGANLELLKQLSGNFSTVIIDEKRHFYSDKTFMDLMLLPEFGLPILGLVAFMLSYFLFSVNSLHYKEIESQDKLPPSFHLMNTEVLQGLGQNSKNLNSLVSDHLKIFHRLFPSEKKLQLTGDDLLLGQNILKKHKQLLKKKGKKT